MSSNQRQIKPQIQPQSQGRQEQLQNGQGQHLQKLKVDDNQNYNERQFVSSAPGDEGDENSQESKQKRRLACRECRQQKSRCDANECAPDPCSRCKRKNIPCQLDSGYKRQYKRARLAEIEKEYAIMKQKFETDPNSQHPGITHQNSQQKIQIQQNQFHTSISQLPPPMTSNPSQNSTHAPTYLPPIRLNDHMPISNPMSPNIQSMGSPQPVMYNSISNQQSPVVPPFLNAHSSSQSQLQPQMVQPSGSPAPLIHSNSQQQIPQQQQQQQQQQQLPFIPMQMNQSVPQNVQEQQQFQRQSIPENLGPSVARIDTSGSMQRSYFGNPISDSVPLKRIAPLESQTLCSPKTLGDVTLTSPQIRALFTDFVKNYHTILPVVDVQKGIERIFKLCPILFWTVMFVSLRRHSCQVLPKEKSQELYAALSPVLKSALAEITISPITRYAPTEVDEPILNVSSVYTVQAFLLYTFWPPLTSSLSADTSWNTIGIAIFQAIRIGIHIPGHSSDGMKTTNLEEEIRTWLGCNIVSQTIATAFGLPGFTQLDGSLLVSCHPSNGIDLPHSLRQMIDIQLFEDQVAKSLNSNPRDPLRLVDASERLPMLELLGHQLNQLQIKLSLDTANPMDDLRMLSLLASRVHLYTYSLLDTERVASFELDKSVIKIYNAALNLIAHVQQSQSRDKQFLKYLPGVYVLTIWQASCIICRLVHSSYSSLLDVGGGKELYKFAMTATLRASVMKYDMAYRSSGIMRTMWSLFKTLHEKQSLISKVTVRSRMCASVFFDSLWILREESGMIKLAPQKKTAAVPSLEENAVLDTSDEETGGDSNSVSDSELDSSGESSDEGNDIIDTEHSKVGSSETKGTPASTTSSNSQQKKRHRTLSSTLHPESSARKIIKTIPLDPQPISLTENSSNGSVHHQDSANNSNQSSPFFHQYTAPSTSKAEDVHRKASNSSINTYNSNIAGRSNSSGHSVVTPDVQDEKQSTLIANKPTKLRRKKSRRVSHNKKPTTASLFQHVPANREKSMANDRNKSAIVESPEDYDRDDHPPLEWDVLYDESLDTDVLFNNINSVMDEFGFHAEDIPKNGSTNSNTPVPGSQNVNSRFYL